MRYILSILTVLFFTSPAFAKDRFLDIQELTTQSGISVWLVEDHSVPVVSLKFSFKGAGSFVEPDEKQGLVQLLSNTLDEGAGDLDSHAFQKALSDNSISLSFSGGRDNFSGSVKTLTTHKDKAFNLLQLALTKPRFDAEPLERMKQANLSRIKQSMTQPNWMAARLMNDITFAGHPYARNSGGTLSSLPKITAEDLRAFVKHELSSERLVIALSGDITATQAMKDIDKIFNALPKIKRDQLFIPLKLKNQGSVTLFEQPIPQTIIRISLPGIRQDDDEYYASKIMNHIFGGGGFGSRLMETIREKEGLTYGIYSGISQMAMTETFSISTSTKNETAKQLVSLIKQESSILKETPITEQELQDAKAYILGSMPLSLTSTNALTSIMISLQLDNLPATYLDTIDQHIEAVTIKDVQTVAQRLLNFDDAITIFVGQSKDIAPTQTITKLPNVE